MTRDRREICFLISRGGTVLWADAGESSVHIADARERWLKIWNYRDQLEEIAHSHPVGPLEFSAEDETTMAALDEALGRNIFYSVVTPAAMIRRRGAINSFVEIEPWWADLLRRASISEV